MDTFSMNPCNEGRRVLSGTFFFTLFPSTNVRLRSWSQKRSRKANYMNSQTLVGGRLSSRRADRSDMLPLAQLGSQRPSNLPNHWRQSLSHMQSSSVACNKLGNMLSWRTSAFAPTLHDIFHCRAGPIHTSAAVNKHRFG